MLVSDIFQKICIKTQISTYYLNSSKKTKIQTEIPPPSLLKFQRPKWLRARLLKTQSTCQGAKRKTGLLQSNVIRSQEKKETAEKKSLTQHNNLSQRNATKSSWDDDRWSNTGKNSSKILNDFSSDNNMIIGIQECGFVSTFVLKFKLFQRIIVAVKFTQWGWPFIKMIFLTGLALFAI